MNNKDKRKFLRFGCTIPAEMIQLEPSSNLVGKAEIDDFSREGIKLILSFNLIPGSDLELGLRLPDSNDIAPIKSEIMWSRNKNHSIEIGLRIKRMDSEMKSDIFDTLYEEWIKDRSKKIQDVDVSEED